MYELHSVMRSQCNFYIRTRFSCSAKMVLKKLDKLVEKKEEHFRNFLLRARSAKKKRAAANINQFFS